MATKFRLLVLFCGILLGTHYAYSQTSSDIKLGEILNKGDLLQLRTQYPLLKDSVSVKMLNLIAEAQLGVSFNRLENAETAMDSLLQYYKDDLTPEVFIGMSSLRAMNLLNLGQYAQAGRVGEDLINTLKESTPFESLYSLVFIERMGKALAKRPLSYLERPSHDIIVPMKYDTVGKGHHFYIPVEVNGITKDYIFDTGCAFANMVSEKYAQEVGLEIFADSIPIAGVNIGFVKLATADSLKIGEMVYHNPIFMVAPPDKLTDSVFPFDGVLGYHFIRDIKEVIIDHSKSSFIFPYQISNGESNMFFSSNIPHVRIEYKGQPFDIVLDTGSVKTDLGNQFAKMFPEVLLGLEEHGVRRGGFGGVSQVNVVTLPKFDFRLSGKSVTLENIEVLKDSVVSQPFPGSLGADFLLSCKRVVINYENAFIYIEPQVSN